MKLRSGCLSVLLAASFLLAGTVYGVPRIEGANCETMAEMDKNTGVPIDKPKLIVEWQHKYADPEELFAGKDDMSERALKIRMRAASGVAETQRQNTKMSLPPKYKIDSPTRITFAKSEADNRYYIIAMAKDSRRNPFGKPNPWNLLHNGSSKNPNSWIFTRGNPVTYREFLNCNKYNEVGLTGRELLLYALYTKKENENKVIEWLMDDAKKAEIASYKIAYRSSDNGITGTFDPQISIAFLDINGKKQITPLYTFSSMKDNSPGQIFRAIDVQPTAIGNVTSAEAQSGKGGRSEGKDPEDAPPVKIVVPPSSSGGIQ